MLRILTTRLNGKWYLSAGLAVFQTLKEWYLSAGLADKICLNLRPESGTFAPEYPLNNLLTEKILSNREIEVVQLLAEGLLYKQIAEKLFITENTVKFHIKTIYHKTSTTNHASLIKYAIRVGISGVEEEFNPKLTAIKRQRHN